MVPCFFSWSSLSLVRPASLPGQEATPVPGGGFALDNYEMKLVSPCAWKISRGSPIPGGSKSAGSCPQPSSSSKEQMEAEGTELVGDRDHPVRTLCW